MTLNRELIAEAHAISNWQAHVEGDTLFYRLTVALEAAENELNGGTTEGDKGLRRYYAEALTNLSYKDGMWRAEKARAEAADAKLEEVEEIVLGLDYAHDHARIQALTLMFDLDV